MFGLQKVNSPIYDFVRLWLRTVGVYFKDKTYVINPRLHWGINHSFQSHDVRTPGIPDDGTFADYIAIDRKYLHHKPPHLTDIEAAVYPLHV